MRSIGTVVFKVGMIQFPLALSTFADYQEKGFNQVCKEGHRVSYKKWCKDCNREMKAEEIKKALVISKDINIVFDKQVIDAIKEKHKESTILKIYNADKVEKVLGFMRTKVYYCSPKKQFEEVYFIMREALKKGNLKIIVSYLLRSRQKLGVLEVLGNQLVMSQILYPEQLRDKPDFKEKSCNENDVMNAISFFKQMQETTKNTSLYDLKDNYKAEVFSVIKEQKPMEAKRIESNFSQALAQMVDKK